MGVRALSGDFFWYSVRAMDRLLESLVWALSDLGGLTVSRDQSGRAEGAE